MIATRYADLAAEVADLNPNARVLLAVKHQEIAAIREVLNAGGLLLGHNIIQQLVAAEEELGGDFPDRDVHVIGHVQSNKARDALTYAHTIETVDKAKTATRLDTVAGSLGLRRNVFIQVNSSGAASQFGIEPDKAEELADHIASLENINLTGLMTIGANTNDESEIARCFDTTRALGEKLCEAGHEIREYSMGMSNDYRIALEHGSTIIRVGRTVFGERDRP